MTTTVPSTDQAITNVKVNARDGVTGLRMGCDDTWGIGGETWPMDGTAETSRVADSTGAWATVRSRRTGEAWTVPHAKTEYGLRDGLFFTMSTGRGLYIVSGDRALPDSQDSPRPDFYGFWMVMSSALGGYTPEVVGHLQKTTMTGTTLQPVEAIRVQYLAPGSQARSHVESTINAARDDKVTTNLTNYQDAGSTGPTTRPFAVGDKVTVTPGATYFNGRPSPISGAAEVLAGADVDGDIFVKSDHDDRTGYSAPQFLTLVTDSTHPVATEGPSHDQPAKFSAYWQEQAEAARREATQLRSRMNAAEEWKASMVIAAHRFATANNLCSEFDDFMEEHGMERRMAEYEVTVGVMVYHTTTVEAQDSDAAKEQAEEEARDYVDNQGLSAGDVEVIDCDEV